MRRWSLWSPSVSLYLWPRHPHPSQRSPPILYHIFRNRSLPIPCWNTEKTISSLPRVKMGYLPQYISRNFCNFISSIVHEKNRLHDHPYSFFLLGKECALVLLYINCHDVYCTLRHLQALYESSLLSATIECSVQQVLLREALFPQGLDCNGWATADQVEERVLVMLQGSSSLTERNFANMASVHAYDPRFFVLCGVDGCTRTYRNFYSFKKHMYRKHRAHLDVTVAKKGTWQKITCLVQFYY